MHRWLLVMIVLALAVGAMVTADAAEAAPPKVQINTTLFCAPMLNPIGGGVGGGSGSITYEAAYRVTCLPKALVVCAVQNPGGLQVWNQTYIADTGIDLILHALCSYSWGPSVVAGTYTLTISVWSPDGTTKYGQTSPQFDVQPEVMATLTFSACTLTYDSTTGQVSASVSFTASVPYIGNAAAQIRFTLLGAGGTFASSQSVADYTLVDGGSYSQSVKWHAEATSTPRTYTLRAGVYSGDGRALFAGCTGNSITVP